MAPSAATVSVSFVLSLLALPLGCGSATGRPSDLLPPSISAVTSAAATRAAPLAGPELSAPTGPLPLPEPPAASALTIVRQLGPQGSIVEVRHLADGKRIVTAAEALDIWDQATGTILRRISAPRGQGMTRFALVPGAEQALAGTSNGDAALWDLTTGAMLRDFGNHGTYVGDVAISKDGTQVLIVGSKSVQWLELATGKVLARREGKRYLNARCGFTRSGPFAVWTEQRGVVVWDIAKNRQRFLINQPSSTLSSHAVVSRDGAYVVTSHYETERFTVVDAETSRVVARLAGGMRQVADAQLFSDGKRIVTCTGYGEAVVWDLETQQPIRRFTDRLSWSAIDFGPGERTVLLAGAESGLERRSTPTVRRYLTATGQFIEQLASHGAGTPEAMAMNLDGSRLAVAFSGAPGSILLWDVGRAEPARWIEGSTKVAPTAEGMNLSDDGERMTVTHSGRIELHNLSRNSVHRRALGGTFAAKMYGSSHDPEDANGFMIRATTLSRDGRLAAAVGHGGTLTLWDVDRGTMLGEGQDILGNLQMAYGRGVVFTPDSKSVIWSVTGANGAKRMFVTAVDRTNTTLPLGTDVPFLSFADITNDGRWAIGWDERGRSASVDFASKKQLCTLPDPIHVMSLARAAGRWFAMDYGSRVAEYELATCRERAHWDLPGSYLRQLIVSGNGERLALKDRFGSVHLLNTKTGKHMTLAIDGRDFIVYDEDGWFDASRGGGRLVTFVRNNQAYLTESVAALYNRPDLLLRHSGFGNPDAVQEFEGLFRARVRSLGLSDQLPKLSELPQVSLTELRVSGGLARVSFDAQSPKSELLHGDVYVDEVPVSPREGLKALGPGGHFEWTFPIESGRHRVEVSATNRGGGESDRAYATADGGPTNGAKTRLYYLGIGVSKYAERSYDLKYSRKDAEDLATVFRNMSPAYSEVRTLLLTDEYATRENLRLATRFLGNARPEDTLVVFVAGHALHADRYYFLTHETDLARLAETAAPFSEVEALIDRVGPRHKLLLVDACHSGDLPPEGIDATALVSGTRGLRPRFIRPLASARKHAGIALPSPLKEGDGERFIHRRLHIRHGATEMASSRGSELSYELDTVANGVFTDAIIAALSTARADDNGDEFIDSDELRAYVSREVPLRTGQLQHPDLRAENRQVPIRFPLRAAPRLDRAAASLPEPQHLPDYFRPYAGRARVPSAGR